MPLPSQPTLSVVIIAQNEADRVRDALRSVAFAGERLVVDGGSQDETIAVAEREGARVLSRPFDDFSRQKQFALEQARGPWIFLLDADERLDEVLASAVCEVISQSNAQRGYTVLRQNLYQNNVLRYGGWGPRPLLRLVQKAHACMDGKPVHESLALEDTSTGPLTSPHALPSLPGRLEHRPYRHFDDHVRACVQYARLGAQQATGMPTRGQLLIHPLARFLKRYLLSLGLLDGVPGLLVCGMGAWTVFLRLAFQREAALKAAATPPPEAR